MLGLHDLPPEYVAWNARHGAPFGRRVPPLGPLKRFIPKPLLWRWRGPFSFQPNSTLRHFEYPWAFHAVPLPRGARVLEVGGGLGGFQFALDRAGCRVVNVDPGRGRAARDLGWPCDTQRVAQLNRLFGCAVELQNVTIAEAAVEPASFDCAFSISVAEHLPESEVNDIARHVFRALKPGGHFVLTVDLFLNLRPFTSRDENGYGRNVDVKSFVELAPFEFVAGDRAELFGYPEFDRDRVLSNLDRYYVGDYPALTQCLVLRKPVTAAPAT
jgi:SAM-dependent methyltransferase